MLGPKASVRNVFIAIAFMVMACISTYSPSIGEDRNVAKSITFEELQSGRAKIVGRLGYTIGSTVRVDGQWKWIGGPPGVIPKSAPNPVFAIDRIDGRKLAHPIEFDSEYITLIYGMEDIEKKGRGSYIAFETCFYEGFPTSAGPIPVQARSRFGIHSQLTIVRFSDSGDSRKPSTEESPPKTAVPQSTIPEEKNAPQKGNTPTRRSFFDDC